MIYLVGIPLLALLAILQSSIFNQIKLIDGRPDIVLLAIVAWGINGRSKEAMAGGLIGGLFLDLLSGLPFGSFAIPLIIVAFLTSLTEGKFWRANLLLPLGSILIASLIYHFLCLAALILSGHSIDLYAAIMRVILPSTFLNLLLALPASQLTAAIINRAFPPVAST
jgi:rod shape-determining protein MreD